MAENEHTPGPWSVDTGREVHKGGVTIFAWPEYSGTPDDQKLADMHLGAAAPDLLEALSTAVDAATVFVDGGDMAAVGAFEEWLPEARAAIARARGDA